MVTEGKVNRIVYNILSGIIGAYAFLVGFILAICVFMSNADTSPEVSLTMAHPLRSIALLALVAWPLVTMLAAGQDAPLGMVLLVPLCLCVAGVGAVCATTDHGAFEAFSSVGALRRGTGKVYLVTSLIVLSLAVYRALNEPTDY